MSDWHLSSTKQKARKRHQCILCCGHIEPGEIYHKRTGVTDGEFGEMKSHLACVAYADVTYDQTDWECLSPGDIDRKQAEEWAKQKEVVK